MNNRTLRESADVREDVCIVVGRGTNKTSDILHPGLSSCANIYTYHFLNILHMKSWTRQFLHIMHLADMRTEDHKPLLQNQM